MINEKILLIASTVLLLIVNVAVLVLVSSSILSFERHDVDPPKNLSKGNGAVINIWIDSHERLDVLKDHEVKYLFVDIGGTNDSGKIRTQMKEIENFIEFIEGYEKEKNHEFILLAYSEISSYDADITSKEFGDNFIDNYRELVEMGFDGLLVDIEPVRLDQRKEFVDFLKELKSRIQPEAIISVYTGHISTSGIIRTNEWEWDLKYYSEVAGIVDLISSPGYDTSFDNEKDYKEHIKRQIRAIRNSGDNSNFLFAIPTHKRYPEFSSIAMEAYYEEISKKPANNILGITVFAEWTAKQGDWETVAHYNELLEVSVK